MNESSRRSAKNQSMDNKLVRNSANKPQNAIANHIDSIDQSTKTPENDTSANDTNSMRIILPVFIENEQKYAQMERRRKIQSSPAKTMRRFSQDSSKLERPPNVSKNLTIHQFEVNQRKTETIVSERLLLLRQ